MHEAYAVSQPAKIGVQIECIAGYDNYVILGTKLGHLLMYLIQQNDSETEIKMDLQLLQYDKNFSKKPITQIEVIPEYQLLVSLTDNQINVNDISRTNFPLVFSVVKSKGASVFCLNFKRVKSLTGETTLIVRMCVAVKRKLKFWCWRHNDNQFIEYAPDIELNDIPKSLCWSLETICVGFKTEYVLYTLTDKDPDKRDLFPTSSSRTVDPCVTIIDGDRFALAKDEFIIPVDPQNLILQEMNKTKGSVRAEDFAGGEETPKVIKSIAWTSPVQALVWDEPFAVALLNDTIEIRTLDSGSTKETLAQSFPDLLRARLLIRTQRGVIFVASLSQLWRIKMTDIPKQRHNLLQQKNFQLALQLTNISQESEEDKKEKIHQIQTLYAFDLFANKRFRESMKEFAKLETDPCDVIRLFPDLLPQEKDKSPCVAVGGAVLPKLEDRDLENGLLALIDYLTDVRYKIKKELQSASADTAKPFGKMSTPLLSIIDTTMLKCYLQTNDSLVAPLLRLNYCHLEESERTLKKYQKYGELIILYQTKGQHKRALQLLQSQAEVPGSNLYGHDRTIQYLQHLGSEHKALIFEFSGWVLEKYPEDGLKIFTEDMEQVENLPRAEVLDYLLKNHKQLVVPYLEHVIHVWNETKPIFHNILIQQYRDAVKELKQDMEIGDSSREKEALLVNVRAKLLDFLKKSTKYNPETVLGDFPYQDLFEERALILGKLEKHEKVLAIYIQILGDVDKAIEYCNEVFCGNDSRKDEIFVLLIKTLLTPPTSPPYSGVSLHPKCLKPDIETVLEILERDAKKVQPLAILQILPDNISLLRLRTFLETALQHQLEQKRKTQVLRGLLYAENLQIHEDRIQNESNTVLISDYSVCPSCKKKFGNQSAFIRYPNGDIVHYSCQQK
ncbi:vam6/Vps39-like protein [Phlebotomus argentipes]|uniref:vam6/Vps39-like protein n=1 Tax=Phlebotomus argentipes TaxID=94469 RepID=UPI0028930F5B|nr:vam6/Vps39-like protein [Phlebotomus argentipes]